MTPVAVSFSDGSSGECVFENKRGTWATPIPVTVAVRRSDDPLRWRCKTSDGRETTGSIPSTMDAKIVASAVLIDFGITDSITDRHRQYPASNPAGNRSSELACDLRTRVDPGLAPGSPDAGPQMVNPRVDGSIPSLATTSQLHDS